jgi:hypothetical protein
LERAIAVLLSDGVWGTARSDDGELLLISPNRNGSGADSLALAGRTMLGRGRRSLTLPPASRAAWLTVRLPYPPAQTGAGIDGLEVEEVCTTRA